MPSGFEPFTPEETREIVFKTMLDAEVHHTIQLDGAGPADYRSVVGFFARQLLKDLRLVGGYDVLYPKVRAFMVGICSRVRLPIASSTSTRRR